jgi:Bifunctional DNA primase/polymerase, N-terminal
MNPPPQSVPGFEDVRTLLQSNGHHPVLIPVPARKKGPTLGGWQQLTYEQTQDPEYQAELRSHANTGVLLGAPSENLCTIDCDTEAFLEHLRAWAPAKETLLSRAARGGQFWFYVEGDRPRCICKLKVPFSSELCVGLELKLDKDGKPARLQEIGEFRAEGGQSLIAGIHEKGMRYVWPRVAPPVTIHFEEIPWHPDIVRSWEANILQSGAAECAPVRIPISSESFENTAQEPKEIGEPNEEAPQAKHKGNKRLQKEALQEELAAKLEAAAYEVAKSLDVFYDQPRKEYVVRTPVVANYQSLTETQFKRTLRFCRLSAELIPQRFWSQIDIVIRWVQEHKIVDYVGALAGRKIGFYEENGFRILVTREAKLIEPRKGDWPILRQFIVNLFGGEDEPFAETQLATVYGWLQLAINALRSGLRRPGPVLAIAGPVESGKSLFQALVTQLLGGRCAKCAQFFQDRTIYNGELFEAEHLMLEDEQASTHHAARMALGVKIKEITANRYNACHPKFRPITTLNPAWHLTISLNDRPERLHILPPFTEDIADKIILLRASYHEMPMPVATAEDQAAFWQMLMSELPAFLDWLLNQFVIEKPTGRFGLWIFQHPELLEALAELSQGVHLLELVEVAAVHVWGMTETEWEGTGLELKAILLKDERTRRDAERLLNWTNATATYLADLAKIRPGRCKFLGRSAKGAVFALYRELS